MRSPITFLRLPKFAKIKEILREIEARGPEELEREMAAGLEESMRVDPEMARTMDARKRACLSIQVPNLAYFPPSMAYIEMGMATLSGFGRHKIKFEASFADTPHCLHTNFGFFDFRFPIPEIEWRTYNIAFTSVRIPIPRIEWQTIRLPTLAFLMNVTKEEMEMFNVCGDTNCVYFALGE